MFTAVLLSSDMCRRCLARPVWGLVLVLVVLTGPLTGAQAQPTGDVRLGVRAGGSYSQLRRTVNNTDRRMGLSAGVLARLPLSTAAILQAEALFVQKGGQSSTQLTGNAEPVNVQVDYRLNYFEVPLLVGLELPVSGMLPYVFAGPYAAVDLGSSVDAQPEQVEGEPVVSDIEYDAFDYGAVFGMSVDLPLYARAVVLDVRYAFGLRDLDPRVLPGTPRPIDRTSKNGAFVFSVGVML